MTAIVGAIVGPQQCGKSSVARAISRTQWFRHKRRSLVFDPWLSNWGPWSWVTDDREKFLHVAFTVHGCCVLWDESSDSMERNGKQDKAVFTRLRQREVGAALIGHPAIYVISHDYATMAPIMRNNLNELVLFRQNAKRATDWADLFTDDALLQSATLEQYEFILKRPFKPARRLRPSSPQEIERYL